jgi:hypothetical protein
MACWSYCHASHPEVWGSIPVFFFFVSSDTRPLVSQGRVCRFFPLFAPLLLPLPLRALGALRPLVGRAVLFFRVFRHETSRVSREGVPLFSPFRAPSPDAPSWSSWSAPTACRPCSFFFPCLQTRDLSCLKGGCAAFSPSFAPLLLPLPLGALGALRPLVAVFFSVSSDTRYLVSQGRVCRFFPLFRAPSPAAPSSHVSTPPAPLGLAFRPAFPAFFWHSMKSIGPASATRGRGFKPQIRHLKILFFCHGLGQAVFQGRRPLEHGVVVARLHDSRVTKGKKRPCRRSAGRHKPGGMVSNANFLCFLFQVKIKLKQ